MKFYTNKTEIAQELGITRPTLDARIKSGEVILNRVEKGDKYYLNK